MSPIDHYNGPSGVSSYSFESLIRIPGKLPDGEKGKKVIKTEQKLCREDFLANLKQLESLR